ncbi:MAG: hypothetical protein AAF747_00965 [Planctomycetota bacterium]
MAGSPDANRATSAVPSAALDLTGDLLCASCGYNLRGLSIRDVCPECSLPVRATLLARVDPRAQELRPLYAPLASAFGIAAWGWGLMVAAVATWAMRLLDLAVGNGPRHALSNELAYTGLASLIFAGVGALTLIRPHGGIPVWKSVAGAIGAIAYAPLCFMYYSIHVMLDAGFDRPYLDPATVDAAAVAERSLARLLLGVAAVVAVLGIRPIARVLVARSAVLRRRAVDRQTLLVAAASLGVGMVGDALGMALPVFDTSLASTLRVVQVALVAVSSVLLTAAIAAAFVDVVKLVPVVARKPLHLADVFGPRDGNE